MVLSATTPPACEGGSCQLFGLFGIFVQCMIGVWCVMTLVTLWRCEKNRRDFCTWIGDMSKQLVGAGWGHAMNIFLALIFGSALESEVANNQCVWYLVGFLSDIFVVTFLCWWVTSTLRPHIQDGCGIDIGEYDSPGREEKSDASQEGDALEANEGMAWWRMWSCQTGLWLLIMTSVKVTVSIGVYLAQDWLYTGLATAFHTLGLCGHENAQLVTSVIIIPVIGDAFQFAVQDTFLKRKVEEQEQNSYEECSSKDLQKGLDPDDCEPDNPSELDNPSVARVR